MGWSPQIGPVEMRAEYILAAAARDSSLGHIVRDMEGVAVKAFSNSKLEEGLFRVANFLANYQHMWLELGNLNPMQQSRQYIGREPLFLDSKNEQLNPKVVPSDYLTIFKDFLQKWAYHEKTGDPVRDWFKAIDRCASLVATCGKL